jgi:hypothetical protein
VLRGQATQLTDDQILRDLQRRSSQPEASSTVQQGDTPSMAHRSPASTEELIGAHNMVLSMVDVQTEIAIPCHFESSGISGLYVKFPEMPEFFYSINLLQNSIYRCLLIQAFQRENSAKLNSHHQLFCHGACS